MLVCLCLGVCDKEVRMTIRSGARSVGDITRACGAGGDCGSCHALLGKMLTEAEQQELAASQPCLAVAAVG